MYLIIGENLVLCFLHILLQNLLVLPLTWLRDVSVTLQLLLTIV